MSGDATGVGNDGGKSGAEYGNGDGESKAGADNDGGRKRNMKQKERHGR